MAKPPEKRSYSWRQAVWNRKVPRWLLIFIALAGFYDLVVAQFLPRATGQEMPTIYEMVMMADGTLAWWGWLLLLMTVVTISSIEFAYRQRSKSASINSAGAQIDAPASRKSSLNIVNNKDDLTNLSLKLKDYASDYSNVKILFANVKYLPLARALIKAFKAADWKTDLTNVPQENHPPRYIEGVNIMARNKSLLDVICTLLGEHGIPDIRPEYREIADGIAPAKWHIVHNRIEIMIGHPLGQDVNIAVPPVDRVAIVKRRLRDFVSEADSFLQQIQTELQEIEDSRSRLTPDERLAVRSDYKLPDVHGWHDRATEYLKAELSLAHASDFSGSDEYRQRPNNESDYQVANKYIGFLGTKRNELMQLSNQIWGADLSDGAR